MADKFKFVGTQSQFNEAIEKLCDAKNWDPSFEESVQEGYFIFDVEVKRTDPNEATEPVAKEAPKSVKSK